MMARPVARDAAATGARERWEGVGVRTPTPLPWGRSPVDTGAPPASAGGMATRRRIAPAPGNSTCLRLGGPRRCGRVGSGPVFGEEPGGQETHGRVAARAGGPPAGLVGAGLASA